MISSSYFNLILLLLFTLAEDQAFLTLTIRNMFTCFFIVFYWILGLISCLRANYTNGISGIRTVQLCLETDHFASGVGDAGWGCGYRNTQMILSSLLQSSTFKDIVSRGRIIATLVFAVLFVTLY